MPFKGHAEQSCGRLCKAEAIIAMSSSGLAIAKLEQELEGWASILLDLHDAPTYLTYMDSYQGLAITGLNQYFARYVRRQIRGNTLSALYIHLKSYNEQALLKEVNQVFTVEKQEVDNYIRRLMWVRMRESRRYLIRRFDEVYGLSRLSYLLGLQSRHFIDQYMAHQAESWSFGQQALEDKALKEQVDAWMSADIDVEENIFQTRNYREIIDRLTYVLKNVSDNQLRAAIEYYEHQQYQNMLGFIEKAMTLHFHRLAMKNNLSDPGT